MYDVQMYIDAQVVQVDYFISMVFKLHKWLSCHLAVSHYLTALPTHLPATWLALMLDDLRPFV